MQDSWSGNSEHYVALLDAQKNKFCARKRYGKRSNAYCYTTTIRLIDQPGNKSNLILIHLEKL